MRMQIGYTMHSKDTCIDVDECLDEISCDFTSSSCVNKDGGFKSKCLDEFNEKKDGTCAYINECIKDMLSESRLRSLIRQF